VLIGILKGLGMNVIAYDYYPNEIAAKELGFTYVSLDQLYKQSRIISLHCPLTPETQHMINKKTIEKMQKGVMIINTGRGHLIDTKALIKGLKEGKIGAAGLDVYEEEEQYFFEDHSDLTLKDDVLARLLTFHNVLVTSHQAFFTEEAIKNIGETTFHNLEQFFTGKKIDNRLN
jgi:D-lactate dehydrogenase